MRLSVVFAACLLLAGAAAAAPDELESCYQSLKDAVARKDAVEVKALAAQAFALARKLTEAPEPESELEKIGWPQRVAFAHDVETYTEYALHATALSVAPPQAVELWAALEEQNPKSQYLEAAYGPYLLALLKAGQSGRIPAVAEKAIVHFPEDEDLLLVLADTSMNRKQTARAGQYAERLLAVMAKHPRPETVSPADWQQKRTAVLGRAYWLAGIAHSERNEYFRAEEDLAACLPLIKGNDAMMAPALFYLGLSNYWMGKQTMNRPLMLKGVEYSNQCAAIKSPFQQQAWRNALQIKTEADKLLARK